MGEPVAEVVGESGRENLGFGLEAAEGAGVDDAVAVARIFAAVGVREFR